MSKYAKINCISLTNDKEENFKYHVQKYENIKCL